MKVPLMASLSPKTIDLRDKSLKVKMYRNGKAEVYEIIDPNLAQTFKGLSDKGADRVMFGFGPRGIFSRYARYASQAITYSPPFVAFNAIRDTLAGAINSAFGISPKGFKPVYSSSKGFPPLLAGCPYA